MHGLLLFEFFQLSKLTHGPMSLDNGGTTVCGKIHYKLLNYSIPKLLLNQAHAWFTEIVFVKNVCVYLSMFVRTYPREQNH